MPPVDFVSQTEFVRLHYSALYAQHAPQTYREGGTAEKKHRRVRNIHGGRNYTMPMFLPRTRDYAIVLEQTARFFGLPNSQVKFTCVFWNTQQHPNNITQ